jgi:hypothetical protein
MQPDEKQVQRSLDALRAAGPRPWAAQDGGATVEAVPVEVFRVLARAPHVRIDRLERARRRLAAGSPSAEALAGRMVDRLVCDRLR